MFIVTAASAFDAMQKRLAALRKDVKNLNTDDDDQTQQVRIT